MYLYIIVIYHISSCMMQCYVICDSVGRNHALVETALYHQKKRKSGIFAHFHRIIILDFSKSIINQFVMIFWIFFRLNQSICLFIFPIDIVDIFFLRFMWFLSSLSIYLKCFEFVSSSFKSIFVSFYMWLVFERIFTPVLVLRNQSIFHGRYSRIRF